MRSRLLLVVIASLLADAASAGPLRRIIGRPRACRATVVQPPHLTRVPQMPRELEPVTLRLKFDKSPTYYAEFTTDATQALTVLGQIVTQRQTQAYFLGWTPRGTTDSGHGVMEMEFLALKMNIDIGGVTIDADTTKPAAAGDKVGALFASAVGARVQFHVTPLGNIVAVVGADELRRRLANTPAQVEPLIDTKFSRDALKSLAACFFEGVPKLAVRPGDTWSNMGKLPRSGLGDYAVETQLAYAGRTEGLDRIDVRQRLAFRRPKAGARRPFTIKHMALSDGAGTGERWFDAARGRLVAAELHQTLAGTLTVEVGGKETPVGVTHTRVQRIRTSDRPLHCK